MRNAAMLARKTVCMRRPGAARDIKLSTVKERLGRIPENIRHPGETTQDRCLGSEMSETRSVSEHTPALLALAKRLSLPGYRAAVRPERAGRGYGILRLPVRRAMRSSL